VPPIGLIARVDIFPWQAKDPACDAVGTKIIRNESIIVSRYFMAFPWRDIGNELIVGNGKVIDFAPLCAFSLAFLDCSSLINSDKLEYLIS